MDQEQAALPPETPESYQNIPGYFYALLNVSKNATDEEIRTSYKKLCKLFHPDKYQKRWNDLRQEEDKKRASQWWDAVQEAYNTLIDPHKRMVYDTIGVKGLKEGALVVPDRTAEELKREFEKYERLKEEMRRREKFNLRGKVQVSFAGEKLPWNASLAAARRRKLTGLLARPGIALPDFWSSTIDLMQEVQVRLSKNVFGTLSATAHSSDGGLSRSTVVLGLMRRDIGPFEWVFARAFTSDHLLGAAVGASRAFKAHAAHASVVASAYAGGPQSYSVTLRAEKQLLQTPNLFAEASYTLGPHPAMKASVRYLRKAEPAEKRRTFFNDDMAGGVIVRPVAEVNSDGPSSLSLQILSTKLGIDDRRALSFSMSISYAYTPDTFLGLAVSIATNGIWIQPSYTKASQQLSVPFLISKEKTWGTVVAALLIPALVVRILKTAVFLPLERRRKLRRLQKAQRRSMKFTEEAKQKAMASVSLMTATVEMKRQHEEEVQGLIIIEARYGKLNDPHASIDVTIPLQYQVENSELRLHELSKAFLPGFYDPCPGEEKQLGIRYLYKNKLSYVVIDDDEALELGNTGSA